MYTLSCKDLGTDDGFVARGDSIDSVIDQMMNHVRSSHTDKWEEMNSNMSEDQIRDSFKESVKQE